MILLGINVDRDERFRVTCHPDDREMLAKALEGQPAEIVESLKCSRGQWYMQIVEADR